MSNVFNIDKEPPRTMSLLENVLSQHVNYLTSTISHVFNFQNEQV